MSQIIEQTTKIHVKATSALSLSAVFAGDVSTLEAYNDNPRPALIVEDQTPAHLANLADRACS